MRAPSWGRAISIYYAGIDGGQSSTEAIIADETGHIVGRGSAGPADEVGEGADSTRLHDALRDALFHALAQASLPKDTRFAAVVAGVSGYEGRVVGRAPELSAEIFNLVHDTENAHAGALGGEPGVAVIAGTGSVAYAMSERGAKALVGGWGYLFGDEGSAFWLARDTIADAMRDADEGRANELGALALQHFAHPSLRRLARAFYANHITRAHLASFAPEVIHAAERGNQRAAQYVRDAAASLAALALHAMRRTHMSSADVAFVGGLTRSSTMRGELKQWLRELVPNARMVAPKYDAAVGSLILAYRAAGAVPERIA